MALGVVLAVTALQAHAKDHHDDRKQHAKSDREITYVGLGRYACSGSDCDRFNARKAARDRYETERRSERDADRYERRREREEDRFESFER